MKINLKRVLVSLMAAVMFIMPFNSANALKYDPKVDYYKLMVEMAKRGDKASLYAGRTFEKLRNEKIDALKMKYGKTDIFTTYSNPKEIQEALELFKRGYTMEDLDLVARIVNAEAGCDWIPDWVQRGVASVIVNRVKDRRYPNTVREVIYQPYQYGPIYNGMINMRPTSRSRANAKYVLLNGPTMPAGVIGQNGNPDGAIHASYYDSVLGTTIYFTY